MCTEFKYLRKESAHLVEDLSVKEEVGTTKDEMFTSSNKDGIFTSSNTDGGQLKIF